VIEVGYTSKYSLEHGEKRKGIDRLLTDFGSKIDYQAVKTVHLSPCTNYLWTLFNSKIPWCLNYFSYQFLLTAEKVKKIDMYLATPKKDV